MQISRRRALLTCASLIFIRPKSVGAEEIRQVEDIVELEGVEQAVAEFAQLPEWGLAEKASGDLLQIESWIFKFNNQDDATTATEQMQRAYKIYYSVEQGIGVNDLAETSVRTMGDASFAWSAEIATSEESWAWGMTGVQKGSTVQVLVGVAYNGNVVKKLGDLAESLVERWPGPEGEKYIDGQWTGESWDALPNLDDLPEGMTIVWRTELTRMFAN